MLRLRSLGSGSTGNATVIEATGLRTRRLLIDCGMSLRVLSQRLGQAGLEPGQIDAIFITHEHADHIGCAQRLSGQWRIPVWMSEGTWRGVLTDLGHINDAVRQALAGCHGLLLECNHDPELLQQSAYPAFLKRRVAGALGHLANDQAAQLAGELQRGQLQHIVAAHLSLTNNRPELTAIGSSIALTVAHAHSGTPWIELG